MPAMPSPLPETLAALQARLDARLQELCDDVANYPTPIARCDEQLTKLIEQRTECLDRIRAVRAIRDVDADARMSAIADLLSGYGHPEDGEEAALVAGLKRIAADSGGP